MTQLTVEQSPEHETAYVSNFLTCLNRILSDREFKKYVHERREDDQLKILGRVLMIASILTSLLNFAMASGRESSREILVPTFVIASTMFLLGSLIHSLNGLQATNRNQLINQMSLISREDLMVVFDAWQSGIKNHLDGRSRKKAALVLQANLEYLQQKALLDPESIEAFRIVLDDTLYYND